MKLFALIMVFLAQHSFAQDPFTKWEKESLKDPALLPQYGHLPKTPAQIKADSDFVKQILAMPQFKTRREASNHLIELGFQYYYRPDYKTAMYRFNQAFLLDPTNSDIFWGYGAIYMAFGTYVAAYHEYQRGLQIDSNNTHLLTDLGTFYLEQFYLMDQMPKNDLVKDPKSEARNIMDSALFYLRKSYKIDSKDVKTAYNLSICYWNIKDCTNAWKFYDETVALGGQQITERYTKDLKKRCKRD